MKSAIYDTVSVLIEASKGKHELKANGSTIKYKGWLAISEDFDASKKDEEKDSNPKFCEPVFKPKKHEFL